VTGLPTLVVKRIEPRLISPFGCLPAWRLSGSQWIVSGFEAFASTIRGGAHMNYYFRVNHHHPDTDHCEALDLPDQKAAWDEATTTCGEMLADLDGSLQEGSDWSMEVSDDHGPLFELTFGARRLRDTASSAGNDRLTLLELDSREDLPLSVPRPAA
jgi:hypothetical protein